MDIWRGSTFADDLNQIHFIMKENSKKLYLAPAVETFYFTEALLQSSGSTGNNWTDPGND